MRLEMCGKGGRKIINCHRRGLAYCVVPKIWECESTEENSPHEPRHGGKGYISLFPLFYGCHIFVAIVVVRTSWLRESLMPAVTDANDRIPPLRYHHIALAECQETIVLSTVAEAR